MHVIPGGRYLLHDPLYRKRPDLARANSLPYTFRKLRIHRNLTKKALGNKFGMKEEYISAIECGSKFPSPRYCLLCASEFGGNTQWVKNKWAKEAIERFKDRLFKRLKLEN